MGVRDTIAKAVMGIKAYHSSPHDFDKFDLKKIGTGEGAQAYGHGLYFAENPEVSGQGGQYWNQFLRRFGNHEQDAVDLLRTHEFDRQAALEALTGRIDQTQKRLAAAGPDANTEGMQSALRHWQAQHGLLASGNPVGPRTYEVNIKADPAQMLDWDKPLSQQPQVTEALVDAFKVPSRERRHMEQWTQPGWSLQPGASPQPYMDAIKGGTKYGALAGDLGGFDRASAALSERGIPGIKYLDEGSRGIQRPTVVPTNTAFGNVPMLETIPSPKQTHNYVVFDPDKIDILKKYGVVGAPAGALGATYDQSQYEVQP